MYILSWLRLGSGGPCLYVFSTPPDQSTGKQKGGGGKTQQNKQTNLSDSLIFTFFFILTYMYMTDV